MAQRLVRRAVVLELQESVPAHAEDEALWVGWSPRGRPTVLSSSSSGQDAFDCRMTVIAAGWRVLKSSCSRRT